MNKIVVDEYEVKLNDFKGILEIKTSNAHIHLTGKNSITQILMEDLKSLTITLENNAILDLKNSWFQEKKKMDIKINCKNNTHLTSHFFMEVDQTFHLDFTTIFEGDHNQCNVLFSVVTEDNGKCFIKTTGNILKNTKENEFLEELKGFALNTPSITFLPELIVDSLDVVANHNATIKCIDSEELFYLESKGIKKENAIDLIKKGFLNQ